MISAELTTFLETEAPSITEQVKVILTKELNDIVAVALDFGANSTRYGPASGNITATHIKKYVDEKLEEVNAPQE
jgi:hypothetical protein